MGMLSEHKKIALLVAIQLIIVGALGLYYLLILQNGKEVMLHVAPRDPRDPLRGDYMTFRYDISSYSGVIETDTDIKVGDVLYLTLVATGDGTWGGRALSSRRPDKGVYFIRGTVRNIGSQTSQAEGQLMKMPMVSLSFGVEDYFIPEGKGHDFPQGAQDMNAQVFINNSGVAVIKQLYVDGKKWP
jgi:uncharacterized membrane-anchored protein